MAADQNNGLTEMRIIQPRGGYQEITCETVHFHILAHFLEYYSIKYLSYLSKKLE